MVLEKYTHFLLLGAGHSVRFGHENKLNVKVVGKPLFRWGLDSVIRMNPASITVVISEADGPMGEAMSRSNIAHVVVANSASMSQSLREGMKYPLLKTAQTLAILPMDMPLISHDLLKSFFDHLDDVDFADEGWIARPFVGGIPGHPVVFSGDCLDALRMTKEDESPKDVVSRNQEKLYRFMTENEGYIRDVDTFDDLPGIKKELRKRRL